MKKDITQYVSDCLPCKRIGAPNVRYLRQVLEKPLPFQMISCDHVGPREWNNERFHYLIIINHYSRFVVAKEMKDLKSTATITVIKELWISHFGAPEAILVDKSASFTSRLFQEFVRNETTAHLIYSSAGYPQGNALNEAVHRGIEVSIAARRTYKPTTSFSDVLCDTILAYNATPHSSTNFSLYYSLFGKQMILPGLQRFIELTPEVIRLSRILDAQRQTMQRAILNTNRQLRLYHPAVINIGD